MSAGSTTIRTGFDAPHDASPIHLVRIVFLEKHLVLVANARVSDLFAAKHLKPSVDIFSRHHGFELLDPHKVLLVKGTQAVNSFLKLFDELNDLRRIHAKSVPYVAPTFERFNANLLCIYCARPLRKWLFSPTMIRENGIPKTDSSRVSSTSATRIGAET